MNATIFKNLNVSDFLTKTSNGKASCKFCNSTFAWLKGHSNIKMHLFMSHPDQLGLTKIIPVRKSHGVTKSLIWTYYSKTDDNDRVASCNLCGKVLSYRSTTTNLKVHLSRSHNEEYVRYLENLPMNNDSTETEFVDANNGRQLLYYHCNVICYLLVTVPSNHANLLIMVCRI